MAKVKAKGEGSALETPAVGRLRTLVRDYLGETGLTSVSAVKSDGFHNVAFGGFLLGSDTTPDLMVEALVGAATFVRQTRIEGLNGLTDLTPNVDSVEDLNTGTVTPLGGRSPKSLFADTEVFIEANRLAARKDAIFGTTVPIEPGASLVNAARNPGPTRKDGKEEIDISFEVKLGTDGSLRIKQKPPAHGLKGVPDWIRTALETTSSVGLIAEKGPVDINAGKGFRLQFKDGAMILGHGVASIVFTPEGNIELQGKNVRMKALDERPAFETDLFRQEQDELEDLQAIEDFQFGKITADIEEKLTEAYYKIERKKGVVISITPKTTPHGSPPPESKRPRPIIKEGRQEEPEEVRDPNTGQVVGVWKAYYDAAKAWGRDLAWDRRRAHLAAERGIPFNFAKGTFASTKPTKKGFAQIRAENRAALEAKFKKRLPKNPPLTDSGTAVQVTSRGISLVSNAGILLQSGVTMSRGIEADSPTIETAGTAQDFKDAAIKAAGVPEFAQIDKAEAALKASGK